MSQQVVVENLRNLSKLIPIEKIQVFKSDVFILVKPNILLDILTFFKYHINCQFEILTCISGVDYPKNKYRFKIVYELLTIRYNFRIKIKTFTHELLGFKSPLIKYVPKNTIELFWFNIAIDTFLYELSKIIINLYENLQIDKPVLLLEGGFASQIHSRGEYTTSDLDMTIFINKDIDEDHIISHLLNDDIQKNIFDKIPNILM